MPDSENVAYYPQVGTFFFLKKTYNYWVVEITEVTNTHIYYKHWAECETLEDISKKKGIENDSTIESWAENICLCRTEKVSLEILKGGNTKMLWEL